VLLLIGSYLLLVFALPVALSALVSYRSLHLGRACPNCRGETLQLLEPKLRLFSRVSPFAALQRRWCLCCGWEGVARVPRERRRPAKTVAQEKVTARPKKTLDVRSVNIDGTPWRVMLQCWRNTDLYYGRFMFVAPSGRLWLDSVETFSGANEHEVLGQALSLPDRMLVHRLRRLVSG
jgi:hypothetical protein